MFTIPYQGSSTSISVIQKATRVAWQQFEGLLAELAAAIATELDVPLDRLRAIRQDLAEQTTVYGFAPFTRAEWRVIKHQRLESTASRPPLPTPEVVAALAAQFQARQLGQQAVATAAVFRVAADGIEYGFQPLASAGAAADDPAEQSAAPSIIVPDGFPPA